MADSNPNIIYKMKDETTNQSEVVIFRLIKRGLETRDSISAPQNIYTDTSLVLLSILLQCSR